jgi:hypothetical protein
MNDLHFRIEFINEAPIIFPDDTGWELLRHEPTISGKSLGALDQVWRNLIAIRQFPIFELGLYDPGFGKLLPIVVIDFLTTKQRVHLERLKCDVCGWIGMTANPLSPDLYVGVPNPQNALREARSHPVLLCPRSGDKLPRHPIWTEPALG